MSDPIRVTDGPDQGMAWHYGSPLIEQRAFAEPTGVVDLSNRDVLHITGPDAMTYLTLIGTADPPQPGQSASTFLLDAHGRIQFFLAFVESCEGGGRGIWGWTEPGYGEELTARLNQGRIRLDATAEVRKDIAVVWSGSLIDSCVAVRHGRPTCLGGYECFLPREEVDAAVAHGKPAGLWAYTAHRIACGVPRFGADTDDHTIPNELGLASEMVSMTKGCYPGQETVARVANLGSVRRRLVRLHLDGSDERFFTAGTAIHTSPTSTGPIGRIGSMSYHHHAGPIALALLSPDYADSFTVWVGGTPGTVEELTQS